MRTCASACATRCAGGRGKALDVAAPYDSMPVHVRAGAIVPTGPEIQYTSEKPADPLVLWVYAGADGDFTLYEDDGLTYGYEKGASARIHPDAEHRQTRGHLPRHAERTDVRRGGRLESEAGRLLVHAQAGQERSL